MTPLPSGHVVSTAEKNFAVFALCVQGIYGCTRDAWSSRAEAPGCTRTRSQHSRTRTL